MNLLVKMVMFFVLLVTIAVWAVVGLIFWIPLLVRATTVFSLALLPAAFNHQDISGLRGGLEDASGFYFRGFRSAILAIKESDTPPDEAAPSGVRIGRILIEMLWTAAFWSFALFVVRPAITKPLFAWVSARLHISLL